MSSLPSRVQIGQRFGRLIALEELDLHKPPSLRRWLCQCDCGNQSRPKAERLYTGQTVSCSCKGKSYFAEHKDVNSKHGQANRGKWTLEYTCWKAMRRRCRKVNDPQYKDYGGRGIVVCDRWNSSFENFFADMGLKPSSKHSIERINTNGHYCPENCVWATQKQQGRNTRRNRLLTFNDQTFCVSEWAERLNIKRSLIEKRLKLKWPVERILTEPTNMQFSRSNSGRRKAA